MNLALISPLPPLASRAASFTRALLPQLGETGSIRLFVRSPEQVAQEFREKLSVLPCADLPFLASAGEVDLPIYILADDLNCAHQIRFLREQPGLVLFLDPGMHEVLAALTEGSGDLPAYRRLLVEDYGEQAAHWPERILRRDSRDVQRIRAHLPLTRNLARCSLGFLALEACLEELQAVCPGLPSRPLPEAGEAGEAILALAREVQGRRKPQGEPKAASPAPDLPSVEAVVVSYNSKKIISPCLQSLLDQDYRSLSITVVDNASVDGSAEFIKRNFPGLQVLVAPKNLGFAGGNNLAFWQSQAKYVVLFNQDAIGRRDFIRELVRVAETDPEIAAVGAKMLMLRCPTVINSVGIRINEGGFAVDRQIGEKDQDPSPVPVPVFGACGGAKLIRTSVLHELGGFDEAFFMYCEDVDLCWRMQLAGKKIFYAPLAVVHHDWHGDLDTDDESAQEEEEAAVLARLHRRRFLCERNRLQCVFKNYELGTLLRVLGQLRRFEKVRLGWIRGAIARGDNVPYFRMVGKAIRSAWRWNLLHLPLLWFRRMRVQRLRKVSDEKLAAMIDEGVFEYSYVGDLEAIHDRSSARPKARISMGQSDSRSLGPGWYAPEVDGEGQASRWNKGRAWLYLSPDGQARSLCLRLARGPVATSLQVHFEAHDLGSQEVTAGEMLSLSYDLPSEVASGLVSGAVYELQLESGTFCPREMGEGADPRQLGLRVAEVWFE